MKQKEKINQWLKRKQKELQKEFRKLVGEDNCEYGNTGTATGVWLKSTCANCGRDFHTVFFIPDNDRCKRCGTLFYKKSRRYHDKQKKKKVKR